MGLFGTPYSLPTPATSGDPSSLSACFTTTITTSDGRPIMFSADDVGHDAIKRTIGCLLLWSTPTEGLDEAVESLSDIWSHYGRIRPAAQVPKITTVIARSGEKLLRPNLDLQSD
jgi:hypothetical protein